MKRKQSYRGIIAVTIVCVISLTVMFGIWSNIAKQREQLELQYLYEQEKNKQLLENIAKEEENNLKKLQAYEEKSGELEELVATVERFEGLSAKEAFEAGLSKQYTSQKISTLVRELAYSLATVTSKSDRREAIEEFEEQVKNLKESFEEETGVKDISYFQEAFAYAKYLKKIF